MVMEKSGLSGGGLRDMVVTWWWQVVTYSHHDINNGDRQDFWIGVFQVERLLMKCLGGSTFAAALDVTKRTTTGFGLLVCLDRGESRCR
jgi:hypothetical protein